MDLAYHSPASFVAQATRGFDVAVMSLNGLDTFNNDTYKCNTIVV